MLNKNDTGFAAICFEQAHRDGEGMAVVAVRGCFDLASDGTLTQADEQQLVLVDEYEGDPHKTPLVWPADIIPYKPNTDVTVVGTSYPPDETQGTSWIAGVRVDADEYMVRITGPRQWEHHEEGWRLTEAGPITHTLLDYRIAASDLIYGALPPDEAPRNPIGIQRMKPGADINERHHAVMITGLEEEVDNPFDDQNLHGFGPLPPFWQPRAQFAGTYDDAWKENRHPQLPEDFDYRFYQSAHPNLIQNGYLVGGETIELARFLPGGKNIVFALPGLQVGGHYHWTDGREIKQKLNLDGVHIDVREEPFRVDITWRGWLPICPAFFKVDLFSGPLDDDRFVGLMPSSLHGVETNGVAA